MMSISEIRGLAATVDAAHSSGILAALSSRALTNVELAAELGIDAEATARVLDVLETWGLVGRDGERHRLAPSTRRELEGPEGREAAASSGIWDRTLDFLRRGSEAALLARASRGEAYAGVVQRLSRWFEPAAERLAERLATTLAGVASPRILDAGAGGGVWSLALLARCPSARATALDLPQVVPVYEAAARARGLEGRVGTLAGDYHRVELPSGAFDVVIAASILHLEAPAAAEALVGRLAKALTPGGLFVAVDNMSDGSPEDERSRAVYALHLALRLPTGCPHREEELRRWIASAGLADVERVRLAEDIRGLSALVARRREA
jgi:SAM-dependent methyltransferase